MSTKFLRQPKAWPTLASNTVTSIPKLCSWRAAARPDTPPPITITFPVFLAAQTSRGSVNKASLQNWSRSMSLKLGLGNCYIWVILCSGCCIFLHAVTHTNISGLYICGTGILGGNNTFVCKRHKLWSMWSLANKQYKEWSELTG